MSQRAPRNILVIAVGIFIAGLGWVGLRYLPVGTGEADEVSVETTFTLPRLSSSTPRSQREALHAAVAAVEGVERVTIREATRSLRVVHDPDTDVRAVRDAIVNAGFEVPSKRKAKPPEGAQP